MQRPPMPELRKSSGAFDLPSIITGVVVVGILAAGVLAAIFGVIPFAQDRGAKQDLSSIRTAEGVAKAKDNRFLDHAGLLDAGYLQPSSTEKTTVKTDAKGTCYVALAKSGTGTVFYSTDAKTDPEAFETDTDPGCLSAEKLDELIDQIGGIQDDTPEGAPRAPSAPQTVSAVSSNGNATVTWAAPAFSGGVPVTSYTATALLSGKETATVKVAGDQRTATLTNMTAGASYTFRVTATNTAGTSVPSEIFGPVTINAEAIINPGFENGLYGWTLGSSADTIVAANYAGERSADLNNSLSQTVKIPAATPVLTYWYFNRFNKFSVSIDNIAVATTPTGSVSGSGTTKWTQNAADLSAYAGKTVTLKFAGSTYLDELAFTAK